MHFFKQHFQIKIFRIFQKPPTQRPPSNVPCATKSSSATSRSRINRSGAAICTHRPVTTASHALVVGARLFRTTSGWFRRCRHSQPPSHRQQHRSQPFPPLFTLATDLHRRQQRGLCVAQCKFAVEPLAPYEALPIHHMQIVHWPNGEWCWLPCRPCGYLPWV